MRKIVAATFVSLDGVMQAPGGPEEDPTGGFKFGGWDSSAISTTNMRRRRWTRCSTKPFDLLLGRKTYDIFAGYWPHYTDGPD